MQGFSGIRNSSKQDKMAQVTDFVKLMDWSKANGRFIEMRFLNMVKAPSICIGTVWVKKEKETPTGVKEVTFPRQPYSFNPLTGEFEDKQHKDPFVENGCQLSTSYYVNAIIRPLQAKKSKWSKKTFSKKELASGVCDNLDSADKTPVRVIKVPYMVIKALGDLMSMNVHKITDKKTGKKVSKEFEVSHPKYGMNVSIKYDEKAPPAAKYNVQRGDKAPLTEEEEGYLFWDLVNVAKENFMPTMTYKQVLKDAKEEGILDEEDDDEDSGKSKKGKGKGDKVAADKKGNYYNDDDSDDDDDDESLGDDDDDDEAPAKKKKSSKGKVKAGVKTKVKPGKKAKPVDDDDDDDETPAKKKKKVTGSKVKPGKGKVKTKVKSGKKKKADDDDDDDDVPF